MHQWVMGFTNIWGCYGEDRFMGIKPILLGFEQQNTKHEDLYEQYYDQWMRYSLGLNVNNFWMWRGYVNISW